MMDIDRTSSLTDRETGRQADRKPKHGVMDRDGRRSYRQTDRQTDGRTDGQMDGRMRGKEGPNTA